MKKAGSAIRMTRREVSRGIAAATMIGPCAAPPTAKASTVSGLFQVQDVRVEWQTNPTGMDRERPRFHWRLNPISSNARNVMQSAFRLQICEAYGAKGCIYDSGLVKSSSLHMRPEIHLPLRGQNAYTWLLQVYDGAGEPCPVVKGHFSSGLLNPTYLRAKWIAAEPDQPATRGIEGRGETVDSVARLPAFRKIFSAKETPVLAHLVISGLGQYNISLNGSRISLPGLNGGWSNYDKRIYYDAYDITKLLNIGPQQLDVCLGNGFFNVQAVRSRYTKFIGSFGQPQVWLQLRLLYADGSEDYVVSDESWQTCPSGTSYSSIYGGEDFDARLAMVPVEAWRPVDVVSGPTGKLEASTYRPMVQFQRIKPVHVMAPRTGVLVFDFGVNHSGRPEIHLTRTTRGQEIHAYPCELLNKDGTYNQVSMVGGASDVISFNYTCRGGDESWQPQFSYTGYRYLQVEGVDRAQIVELVSLFLHDDLAPVGTFVSTDQQLNTIHELIEQALRSNMASVLTDCPHREKLGWLEQIYLNATTAMMNYDTIRLYEKMTADMRDAQVENGMVPSIAPEFVKFINSDGSNTPFRDSPEWGAALILASWAAFRLHGDTGILEDNYDAMCRRVAYLETRLNSAGLLDFGLGDWYDIGPGAPGFAQLTSKAMTGTATFYSEVTVMAEVARRLGKPNSEQFAQRAKLLKASLRAALYDPLTARFDTGSQAAQAIALVLELIPDSDRARALAILVKDIKDRNYHVSAGDIGFHYVVRALSDNGCSDVLYAMLSRNDEPSYGQQLRAGATALTEAWNARPESSQNHFMLGHAEIWFYQGLGGLNIDFSKSGDDAILLAPQPVVGIDETRVSYDSILGTISCRFSRRGKRWRLNASIPAGAMARIRMPCSVISGLRESGKPLTSAMKLESHDVAAGVAILRVGSGNYNFTASA